MSDNTSTMVDFAGMSSMFTENVRYAFTVAAMESKRLGYSHFHVSQNENFLAHMKENNAKNYDNIETMCTDGFNTYSLSEKVVNL